MKQIAIIGAGPAGYYTAQQLVKNAGVMVTLFERRMAPFGLVRYGVAPDHSDVKNAISKFETLSKHPQVQFVGGCDVGVDLSIKDLQKNFDAVVFSYGAAKDRSLGIPDESRVRNVFSARSFVGWYNGDPEIDIQPDLLSNETALIVGQGNVALDCARILLAPIDHLAKTDISERALELLRESKIRHVHVIGRRGPLEAAFTSKEVRELMALPNVEFFADPIMKEEISKSQDLLGKNRAKKRLMDILLKGSKNSNCSKSWSLKFLASPMRFEADSDWYLKGVHFERNRLQESKAIGTGETEFLTGGLLIKSVGYLNQAIPGIPFDTKNHVIPNQQGRVVDRDGNVMYGLYCSGWIKTGPVGVLASTLYSSQETARHLLDDLKLFQDSKPGLKGLTFKSTWTTYQDWEKIDHIEITRGNLLGKPREKICSINEMREIISK